MSIGQVVSLGGIALWATGLLLLFWTKWKKWKKKGVGSLFVSLCYGGFIVTVWGIFMFKAGFSSWPVHGTGYVLRAIASISLVCIAISYFLAQPQPKKKIKKASLYLSLGAILVGLAIFPGLIV